MLIYLHGFNSGGTSSKAAQLRRLLAPVDVLAPTYPAHRVDAALEFLRNYIRDAVGARGVGHPLVLAGSSLGGLYAHALAPEFDATLVLINPSIQLQETLLRCVGHNRNEATGEEYELTADQVRALAVLATAHCNPQTPTLLLLDAGDELLDYRVAEAWCRGCGKTLVYAGGSHRFEHLVEAATEIGRLHGA